MPWLDGVGGKSSAGGERERERILFFVIFIMIDSVDNPETDEGRRRGIKAGLLARINQREQ
jgi:hypothetical protein